jgi:hypothetical protein
VSEDKNRTSHWSPTYEIDTTPNPGYWWYNRLLWQLSLFQKEVSH